MFSDYREIQSNFYDAMIKSVLENGKVSHAYFIETNHFSDSRAFAIAFAKFLICTSHKTEKNTCDNCTICHHIDLGIYPDFKLIEPDGLWIKKEQLLDLQTEFKTKSLDNRKRVYIINGADKLNKSSANSILKFLEEPEENIVAILLAPNRNQVLPTILSRCQLFQLKPSEEKNSIDQNRLNQIVNFCTMIEEKGPKTIAFLNQIWDNILNSKEGLLEAFQLVQQFYESTLYFQLNHPINDSIFQDYEKEIKKVSSQNTKENLLRKIELVSHLPMKINSNVNQNLMLDKIIIELSGGVAK